LRLRSRPAAIRIITAGRQRSSWTSAEATVAASRAVVALLLVLLGYVLLLVTCADSSPLQGFCDSCLNGDLDDDDVIGLIRHTKPATDWHSFLAPVGVGRRAVKSA